MFVIKSNILQFAWLIDIFKNLLKVFETVENIYILNCTRTAFVTHP